MGKVRDELLGAEVGLDIGCVGGSREEDLGCACDFSRCVGNLVPFEGMYGSPDPRHPIP